MPERGLPKHHIDTSVLIEPEKTEDGRLCRRYLQKLNYNYAGVLSFPVLSEIFVIISNLEDFNQIWDFLEPLLATIKLRKMEFYSPKDTGTILNDIQKADERIGSIDREILASAFEDKADALITLDRELIKNKTLEKLLRIKIVHPKDML